MSIYTVWVVSPREYAHSQAFTEVAWALRDGLIELGHAAAVATDPSLLQGRTIVLGAHLFKHIDAVPLPEDTIIFNTEQLGSDSSFVGTEYLDVLRQFTVWDYSYKNLEYMAPQGITGWHCEIGYMPCLTNITPQVETIDVVFCGSINPRRQKILAELKDAGVGIVPITGYAAWRNDYIARARIVLNMHHYDTGIFEIVRCSHSMANRKCIVSESGLDGRLESPYYDGVAFAEYENIVDRVKDLLAKPAMRASIAEDGYRLFSARSQTNILRGLV